MFALGRLRFRPLRRRKLAKQPRWSEPGGAVSFGGWMRVGSGEFDMRAYMNSNLRIAGFQVFSVAKIAIVCLVCFSSDLRGFALHKSRRGRPQLLDPRPWCVWQTLATARSPKLTTPRPTRKLISRQERTQYLPLMQGSVPILPQFRRFGSGPPPRTRQPQPRRGWGEGSVGSKLQRKFSCEWSGTVTVARESQKVAVDFVS